MQQQATLMPQVTGYGQGQIGFNQGSNGIMQQATGYIQYPQQMGMSMPAYQQTQSTGFPSSFQQQLHNGQFAANSPFADPTNSTMQNFSMQQLQPQPTGINSVLPPPLMPQPTGFGTGNVGTNGYGQMPPVPPIPQGPIAAPLIAQKTGPPPPVRFGVTGVKRLAPQPTGRKANLAAATPQNPFGLN